MFSSSGYIPGTAEEVPALLFNATDLQSGAHILQLQNAGRNDTGVLDIDHVCGPAQELSPRLMLITGQIIFEFEIGNSTDCVNSQVVTGESLGLTQVPSSLK